MRIFIGNLPGEATLAELDRFLGGVPLQAEVTVRKGRNADAADYHYFIARADDARHAAQLIERFDGMEFHGQRIVARAFVPRRCAEIWDGPERRINAD